MADADGLVGRGELLTSVVDAALAGRGVLVCGAPGSGVTHALDRVAERLRRAGRPVRCLSRTATDPLHEGADGEVWIVDDADRAAPEVVGAVAARAGAATVVGVHAVRAEPMIERLWRSQRLRRFDLSPLTAAESERLLTELLGAPVDIGTVRRLARLAAGRPLVLRELAESSSALGELVRQDGLWRMHGEPSVSQRVADLVGPITPPLSPSEQSAFDLVTVAERLPLAMVDAVADRGVIAALERKGHLVVAGPLAEYQEVRIADPLRAHLRLSELGVLTVRESFERLVDASARHGIDDLLRMRWLVGSGRPLADATSEAAGRVALAHHDIDLAQRLVGARPGNRRLRHVLATILEVNGRIDEAIEVHRSLVDDPETSPDVWAFAAFDLSSLSLWSRGRRDEAFAVADRLERAARHSDFEAECRAFVAAQHVFAGEVEVGLHRLDELLPRLDGRARAVACMAWSSGAAVAGQTRPAERMAAEGAAVRSRLGAQPTLTGVAIHHVDRLLALRCGGRLTEAARSTESVLASAMHDGPDHASGWVSIVASLVAIDRGELDIAERHAGRAEAIFGLVDNRTARRWAIAEHLLVAAMRADADAAARRRDQLLAAEPSAVGFMEPEVRRAEAWGELAAGSRSACERKLLAAARVARRSGQFALEANALHDLVRIGSTAPVSGRLSELVELSDSATGPARAAHADAWFGQQPTGLLAVSEAFEEIGSPLWAAEAAGQAARVLHEAGSGNRSRAAARRCRSLAEAQQASTPAIEDARTLELTAREREVAIQAARGRTSREIAECLGISTRTVDNLLGRVYRRLSIRSRDDLAALVLPSRS